MNTFETKSLECVRSEISSEIVAWGFRNLLFEVRVTILVYVEASGLFFLRLFGSRYF